MPMKYHPTWFRIATSQAAVILCWFSAVTIFAEATTPRAPGLTEALATRERSFSGRRFVLPPSSFQACPRSRDGIPLNRKQGLTARANSPAPYCYNAQTVAKVPPASGTRVLPLDPEE